MIDFSDNTTTTKTDYFTTPAIDNPSGSFAWIVYLDVPSAPSGSGWEYLVSMGSWGANYSMNMHFGRDSQAGYANTFHTRVGNSIEIDVVVTDINNGKPWVMAGGVDGSNTRLALGQPGDTTWQTTTGTPAANIAGTGPSAVHFGVRSNATNRSYRGLMGYAMRVAGSFPSEAQLLALAHGQHPLASGLGPDADFLWNMWEDTAGNQADIIAEAAITRVGTPKTAGGSAIVYPWPLSVTRSAAAAGGTGHPQFYSRRWAA